MQTWQLPARTIVTPHSMHSGASTVLDAVVDDEVTALFLRGNAERVFALT